MDPHPPTMGDLAWSAVEDTRKLLKQFSLRLDALEKQVAGAGSSPLHAAREQEAAVLGQKLAKSPRLNLRDEELEKALAERDKRGPRPIANQPSLRDSFIDGFNRGWEAREQYQEDIDDLY